MSARTVIAQRVGRPYVIEAVRMLEAAAGSVEGIDAALEAAGYRLGPLRLLDEVGLDADLALDRRLADAHPTSTRFDPPALQVRLVEAGHRGRAAGAGFYRYAGEVAVPEVHVAPGPVRLAPGAIVERIELATINEAYRVVEDGLGSPPAIDATMRAVGAPRGPFELVDELGLRRVIERLGAIEREVGSGSGDQYRVATLLWQMATV